MFFCSYSPYPCNSKPLTTVYTHVFTTGCLYIYIMYTYQMQDMYNTCCFPSPSATQPSPIPPSHLHPANLKQTGPPLCATVLLKVSYGFFLAPVAIVLAVR